MKRLFLFFIIFSLSFFGLMSCKTNNFISEYGKLIDNQNKDSQDYLIPNTFSASLNDKRPFLYDFYDSKGEIIKSFNSLYTAIDYVLDSQILDSYILSNKTKIFQYTQKEDMYFYQNINQLDGVMPQDLCYLDDLFDTDGIIAISNQNKSNIFHSFEVLGGIKDNFEKASFINMVDPNQDAFVLYKTASNYNKQTFTIDLSSCKIFPTYNQNTYIKIGFKIFSKNGAVNDFGIMCNTLNGNWYWFLDGKLDEKKCVLLSNWNKDGYFAPQQDVTLTANINNDQNLFSLTLGFSSGRIYQFDVNLEQADNMSFFAGLDIDEGQSIPDYMNGSKVQNLIISQAKGYSISSDETHDLLNFGEIKNSKILIYNTAAINADYSKGVDIYNVSYDADYNKPPFSERITAVQNAIDGLKTEDEITLQDKESIRTVLKQYEALSKFQKPFINSFKLQAAKTAYIQQNEGLEKVVAVADSLRPFLDADKDYVIDNADIVYDAWDIYNNLLTEDEQDKVSGSRLTRIKAYYNQAFELRLQAENVIIAVDSLKPYSTQKKILSVYEKFLALDDAVIEKIIGSEKSIKLLNLIKDINPKVIDVIKKILEIGYTEPKDYMVYYGINNRPKILELIGCYNYLNKQQTSIIPDRLKRIYQTASNYFKTQTGYMNTLKKGITNNDKASKLIEVYNKMDLSTKWHFKNDSEFSECYEKLRETASDFGI